MIHRRCFVIDEDSANGFGGFGLPDEWFATELDNNCFGALTPIYSESYQKENDMSLTETQIEYLSTDGVKLVRACVKRLGGELDREELEQECLLAATYAMRRYDPSRVNTKLSTYIWTVVENRIRMALRHSRTGQARYERYGRRPAWMIPLDRFFDPRFEEFEEWDEQLARHTWFKDAIKDPRTGLSEQERIVIQLTVAGFNQKDIGRVIGKGQSQVSRNKEHAMAKLKDKQKRDVREGRFYLDEQ